MGVWKGLPYNPEDTSVGRTDEGVDYSSRSPYMAVAPGTVVHIDPNFYNGTPAVYIRLDKPVQVNGRTYRGVYYSETQALVRVGQRVQPGQDVIGPGNAEIGFAAKFGSSDASWLPAAHATYHEGDTTQAGSDFASTTGSGHGGSFWSKVGGVASDLPVVGGVVSPKDVYDVATGAVSGAKGAVDTAAAIGSFLGRLTDPRFLLRMLEVAGGVLITLLGLYLLAKQAGLGEGSPDVPVVRELSPPAARAAGAVQARRVQRRTRRVVAEHERRQAGTPPRLRQPLDVSEASERRAKVRERASRAQPSNEIPF